MLKHQTKVTILAGDASKIGPLSAALIDSLDGKQGALAEFARLSSTLTEEDKRALRLVAKGVEYFLD